MVRHWHWQLREVDSSSLEVLKVRLDGSPSGNKLASGRLWQPIQKAKNVAIHVFSYRESLSLQLQDKGSRNSTCMRCEKLEYLLNMVIDLKEEMERLRSVWMCE